MQIEIGWKYKHVKSLIYASIQILRDYFYYFWSEIDKTIYLTIEKIQMNSKFLLINMLVCPSPLRFEPIFAKIHCENSFNFSMRIFTKRSNKSNMLARSLTSH